MGKRRAASKIQGMFRKYKYRKRKRKNTTLTKRVAKLSKQVYANQNPGWVDAIQPNYNIDSDGTIDMNFFNINQIIGVGQNSQVADPKSRLGNKITGKKLELRFHCQPAKNDIFNVLRIIIFKVPDPTTTPPTVLDILQTQDVYSWYRKDPVVKWKKLYETTIQLQCFFSEVTQGTDTFKLQGQYYPAYKNIKYTIDLKDMPIWFKNLTGNLPTRNQIGIMMISDSDDAATGHPRITIRSRFHFDP